jgi:hypothetical protein
MKALLNSINPKVLLTAKRTFIYVYYLKLEKVAQVDTEKKNLDQHYYRKIVKKFTTNYENGVLINAYKSEYQSKGEMFDTTLIPIFAYTIQPGQPSKVVIYPIYYRDNTTTMVKDIASVEFKDALISYDKLTGEHLSIKYNPYYLPIGFIYIQNKLFNLNKLTLKKFWVITANSIGMINLYVPSLPLLYLNLYLRQGCDQETIFLPISNYNLLQLVYACRLIEKNFSSLYELIKQQQRLIDHEMEVLSNLIELDFKPIPSNNDNIKEDLNIDKIGNKNISLASSDNISNNNNITTNTIINGVNNRISANKSIEQTWDATDMSNVQNYKGRKNKKYNKNKYKKRHNNNNDSNFS